MRPTRQEVLLSIIAIALCTIAVKLIFFGPSTRGDLAALSKIQDPEEKKAAFERYMHRIPVVWVRGGDIDVSGSSVTVSGSVEIER